MLNVDQRQQLYALLCALFSYPDRELLEQLASDRLLQTALLLDDMEGPPVVGGERLLEELQVAYTDLFINRRGGVPAPPYGSIYLDPGQQLFGPSTQAVAALYQGEGLVLDQSSEPPDYLPTELEFLYFLVDKEAQGLQRQELAVVQSAMARQARFFGDYLAPWVSEFCRRLRSDPLVHPWYRWSAALLARFCTEEEKLLASIAQV